MLNRRLIRLDALSANSVVGLAFLLAGLVACVDSSPDAVEPTANPSESSAAEPTATSSGSSIVVQSIEGRVHEADLGSLRTSSELVELPTVYTDEGDNPAKETIEELAVTFPLVAGYVMRPLGSWLPYGGENAAGETEYVRFVAESPSENAPPIVTFEGVVVHSGEHLVITSPPSPYTGPDGCTNSPAEEVSVRGHAGYYLQQQAAGTSSACIPLCQLIWEESSVIWKYATICDNHPLGLYGVQSILDGANQLEPPYTTPGT